MSDSENDGSSLRRNNLPPDIIADVLSRLPVNSLYRFKCVSPSWNSLISSPYFAQTHFNRTHTNNPNKHLLHNIVLQSITQDLYTVDLTADVPFATKLDLPSLQPPDDKVLGSCNGLLLFCRTGRSNFFLLNPSTRECKKLPSLPFVLNPGHGFYSCLYGVGYDSTTDDYKVVMLSFYDESDPESESESYPLSDTTTVAVYSLKSNAWRRIQDTQYIHWGMTFGAYFNGCLHWVCRREGSYLIVAFDLADEVFREVSLPASWAEADDEIRKFELVVVGGCLCLVYTIYMPMPSRNRQIEVWTMEESGVGARWTKIMTDIDRIRPLDLLGLLAENEFVLTAKVQILPGVTDDKLVVYNHQTGTLRDIVVRGIPTKFSFWGTYVESLLPCLS
ncbi:F-box/kelch-repeat protein At3g06240-like [Rhododendron vialii]|uniref:F-box/kelch-repeat protein At3g06240-like n=1 Tax=Rhododendron vialii TaxID=182163 RepID=UPI00265EF67E|nr:F-box/kelch-repeat protein At3g06240-like [Rhododendron vialii]XP_058198476.1 F-box/kelch-repeat protein At3g06240-like [Rhododendron vialii]XP_058198483.1 F-box/kelch-repeat protein At3g06240-like [Rhododendron vialii]XP_058198488.1 F-box/kelch-repeat protein At3g06240-like [Rhododendron vialii]XP_058198493.1 F-box/kelch-repeat protein At3g06240-like [Rhododendron vialii]XP_058198497.1 F-box/kelch-repeat protein At3g06240-like [Rhododendron vialii]XP_058198503.1 F-box/kelch-repeat protein